MKTAASHSPVIRFGVFELDLRSKELHKQGMKIRLQGKPVEILAVLLERPGDVVTREDLQKRLWPADTFVDFEQGLNNAMKRLRAALDDNAETPRFIETLPRRGYRFVGAATGAGTVASDHRIPLKNFLGSKQGALLAVFGTLALLALAAALVGMNGTGWRDQTFTRRPKPNIQALAVLPLANLSAEPEQEYFADGMTEELITELGKISGPRVISRQSVMQYKGSKKSLAEIARELNVDAVLEGAVGRSGDRVKITVHLAQVSPERQLWAQEYDRSGSDVLSLQGEIARAVTHEIRPELTAEDRTRLSNARPVNPEAHTAYLHGRSMWAALWFHAVTQSRQYVLQDIETAIAYFKQAIDKDPDYAQAYAGLAEAYIFLGQPMWGHSPKETLSDAKEAATTALKLDPSLPEAHFSLAQTLEYDWNWPEAEKEYKLALKLNPNYADAYVEYGRLVQALGRNDEALAQLHQADELDPFNISVKRGVAYVTYASRQYDLALKLFESLGDNHGLVWTYREKGMYPEAIAAWGRWKQQQNGYPSQSWPDLLSTLASIYGLEGRKEDAEKLIDELKETARHRDVSGVFFAEAYVGLGQNDQAIIWLERAYQEHDQWMVFANAYPGLDRLHSEPRFQALMRRMNFPH